MRTHSAPCCTAVAAAGVARGETLWIDVRSPEEYAADRIEGDPNLPYKQIEVPAEALEHRHGCLPPDLSRGNRREPGTLDSQCHTCAAHGEDRRAGREAVGENARARLR